MSQSKFKAASLLAGTALVALGVSVAGQANAGSHARVVKNTADQVSLRLSGMIARKVVMQDDGDSARFRHTDSNYSSSRIRFHPSARINKDIRVVGTIETAIDDARNGGGGAAQFAGRSGNDLQTRVAEISFRHAALGNLTIGSGNKAANGVMNTNTHGVYAALPSGAAFLNSGAVFKDSETGAGDTGPSLGAAFGDFDFTSRGSRLRYDSPNYNGFVVSASHDDETAVEFALRYSGRFAGSRVRASAGYSDSLTSNADNAQIYGGLMSFTHSSGFGATGGCQYENEDQNDDTNTNHEDPFGCTTQVHLARKFNDLGLTTMVFEWEHQTNLAANGDTANSYGFTVQQNIDAASVQVFAKYATFDLERDATNTSGNKIEFQDINMFAVGTRIRF